MANTTLKFGNGEWYGKEDTILAYNDLNSNYKPLPFNYERGSTATRINKEGLIETVGANEPRIDYKNDSKGALLLEPSRSNLIPYSQDFSNAAWGYQNVTVNSNQIIAPDGTLTADKITDNSTNGAHRITDGNTTSSSGSFTYSIFLKKGTLTTAQIQVFNSATASSANVNLVTGTITSDGQGVNHTIQDYGNDWFKCSISGTLSNTATTVYLYLKQKPSYIGNGDYLYAWGAQLEEGSYPTSYIPTQGTVQTRLADSCSQTVPDGVIGQTEGTVFVDFKPQTLDATSRFLSIENSSSVSNGWMGVFAASASGDIRFRFYGDGWDFNSTLIIEKDTRYKIAVSYKNGVQTSAYVNGNLIGNLTASLSGKSFQKIRLSEAQFGVRGDADFKDIKLYNTRLSNSELIALTQV